MLYKFDRKYFREIINGEGDIRKDRFLNIITLKILTLQKKSLTKKMENLIMYKKGRKLFVPK